MRILYLTPIVFISVPYNWQDQEIKWKEIVSEVIQKEYPEAVLHLSGADEKVKVEALDRITQLISSKKIASGLIAPIIEALIKAKPKTSELKQLVLRFVWLMRLKDVAHLVLDYIKDEKEESTTRVRAIEVLTRLQGKEMLETFEKMIETEKDRHVHGALVRTYQSFGGKKAKIAEGKGIQLGADLPEFALKDIADKKYKFKDLIGKPVVLTFWCATCPSCRGREKTFEKLSKEYKDVAFFMIDSNYDDTPEKIKEFLQKNKLNFIVLIDDDSKLAQLLNARKTTTTAIFSADGKLVYYGAFSDGTCGKEGFKCHVEEVLKELAAGKEITTKETKPNG